MAKGRVRHHVNPLADRTEHSFEGFENDRPIIIDIGADRGEFVQQLIDVYGDKKNYIISEIRKPLARKLEEKFMNYENVVVFDGDMVRNFEAIVKPSVDRGVLIEEVYVNFPDPWFKARHKKRRVINSDFLKDVQRWVPLETSWIFQTDQKQVFDETVDVLNNVGGIAIEMIHEPPHGCTTKWESAKVSQGAQISRLIFHFVQDYEA